MRRSRRPITYFKLPWSNTLSPIPAVILRANREGSPLYSARRGPYNPHFDYTRQYTRAGIVCILVYIMAIKAVTIILGHVVSYCKQVTSPRIYFPCTLCHASHRMTNIANAKKILFRGFSTTDQMKHTEVAMFLTFVQWKWLGASLVNSFLARNV